MRTRERRHNSRVRHPSALPEPLDRRPFTVSEAAALGVGRGRLRSRDLSAPFHGVRHRAVAMDIRARALAYRARMPPEHFFSHLTAAELLGLRMPQGFWASTLHVTSMAPARAPRGRGVSGHQSGHDIRTRMLDGGLRVSDAVDTWCTLSATIALDDLIVLGDGLLRRKNPLATLDELHEAAHAQPGCRGGLPEPVVNHRIVNEFGAVIAHADLAFPGFRTVVEYDGGQHRTDERQFDIDIDRLDEIVESGWRVIRVNKQLMARRVVLIGKVTTALRQNGWRGN